MAQKKYTLPQAIQKIKESGRYGDTEIIHVSKPELEYLVESTGIPLTTNPVTGEKEAFLQFLLPLVAPSLLSTLGVGALTGLEAALVSGGATALGGILDGQSAGDALMSGVLGGLTSGLFGGAGDAASAGLEQAANRGVTNAATAALAPEAASAAASTGLQQAASRGVTNAATQAASGGGGFFDKLMSGNMGIGGVLDSLAGENLPLLMGGAALLGNIFTPEAKQFDDDYNEKDHPIRQPQQTRRGLYTPPPVGWKPDQGHDWFPGQMGYGNYRMAEGGPVPRIPTPFQNSMGDVEYWKRQVNGFAAGGQVGGYGYSDTSKYPAKEGGPTASGIRGVLGMPARNNQGRNNNQAPTPTVPRTLPQVPPPDLSAWVPQINPMAAYTPSQVPGWRNNIPTAPAAMPPQVSQMYAPTPAPAPGGVSALPTGPAIPTEPEGRQIPSWAQNKYFDALKAKSPQMYDALIARINRGLDSNSGWANRIVQNPRKIKKEYAEGGMVDGSQMAPEQADQLVMAAMQAISGQLPEDQAQQVIQMFVQMFGREALEDLISRVQGQGQPQGGGYVGGSDDGMADTVPASINGQEPAALSSGEYVIPADVVSHLGNGNNSAGAKVLKGMEENVRMKKTGKPHQPEAMSPEELIPF